MREEWKDFLCDVEVRIWRMPCAEWRSNALQECWGSQEVTVKRVHIYQKNRLNEISLFRASR